MNENINKKVNSILDILDNKGLKTYEAKANAIKDLVDIVYGSNLFIDKAKIIMELIKIIDKEGSNLVRDFLTMLEKTKKHIEPEDIRELQYTMMPPEYWLGDE